MVGRGIGFNNPAPLGWVVITKLIWIDRYSTGALLLAPLAIRGSRWREDVHASRMP